MTEGKRTPCRDTPWCVRFAGSFCHPALDAGSMSLRVGTGSRLKTGMTGGGDLKKGL